MISLNHVIYLNYTLNICGDSLTTLFIFSLILSVRTLNFNCVVGKYITVHLFGYFQGKLNSLFAVNWYQSYFSKTTVAGEKADFSLKGLPCSLFSRLVSYKILNHRLVWLFMVGSSFKISSQTFQISKGNMVGSLKLLVFFPM